MHVLNMFDLKKIRMSKILGQQSPNFGTSTWESQEKMSFKCSPIESHRIYYREGSGASSQRLWVV
jgi:hypothetical protein